MIADSKTRVYLTFDDDVLELLEDYCYLTKQTKSDLVQSLVVTYLSQVFKK